MSSSQGFFLLIFPLCIVICAIFLKVGPSYNFLHELSHWVMAKIFFRKTRRFVLNKYGGKVEIANPNQLIILAPYTFPVFTYTLLFLFIFINFIFPLEIIWIRSIYSFLIFSFSAHLVLTIKALSYGQTDIKATGKILAYSTIISGNLLLLLLVFSFLS